MSGWGSREGGIGGGSVSSVGLSTQRPPSLMSHPHPHIPTSHHHAAAAATGRAAVAVEPAEARLLPPRPVVEGASHQPRHAPPPPRGLLGCVGELTRFDLFVYLFCRWLKGCVGGIDSI